METVYFGSSPGSIRKFQEQPDGSIIGNALLFYEGEHTDNKGRIHQVPAQRINLIASNTNIDFNKGLDIPLKFEHRKSLIHDDGSVNRFGVMCSAVSCRPIEETDLANPRLEQLVGKIGAFAKVQVMDKVEAVKNKTIKAISAGIDPIKNKFIEISAVNEPSLAGASLLFSKNNLQADFSQHGIINYKDAKDKIEAWEKPHAEMQKMFDIFLGTLQAIEQSQEPEMVESNSNALVRTALEDFTEDMIDYLNISLDEDTQQQPENIYSSNPYDQNLYQGNNTNNYSEEDPEEILEFNQTSKRNKRKRRVSA